MATSSSTVSNFRPSEGDDLLLRELNHRCKNDLQLVVSMLALQTRRAKSAEARQALTEAMERVAILARARSALQDQGRQTLEDALREICAALRSQAEPYGIEVSLEIGATAYGLTTGQITTLALAVNELATNAIRHAFVEEATGRISVEVREYGDRGIVIFVDDDGLPLPGEGSRPSDSGGLGLGLVKRLVVSVGGLLIPPQNGSKQFEIRMPL